MVCDEHKNFEHENKDLFLSAYAYDLPKESIAQYPLERGTSRLCIVDKLSMDTSLRQNNTILQPYTTACGNIQHSSFEALVEALPPNALLIANNSRVVPTRLFGKRPVKDQGKGQMGGGRVECLLMTPLPHIQPEPSQHELLKSCFSACVEVLIKPAKHASVGTSFMLADNSLCLEVLEKGTFGKHIVRMYWSACLETLAHGVLPGRKALAALESLLETHGQLPLPPYIQRDPTISDKQTYQTTYAQHTGSIAAPTAGLHFTPNMRQTLANAGFDWAELTLHVGYGTFSPVRCDDIREHEMHPEYVVLSEATSNRIAEARAKKQPIIAIGTTAARTLEAIAQLHDGQIQPHTGYINIFIHPGYTFRVIDGLLTNFHLPESTLLMLVSALLGRERALAIYGEAVREGYRFFSYGDAMLIR